MNIVCFGFTKPSITTFHGGYRVPVALQQVDAPDALGGTIGKAWNGYVLELAGLTAHEFDRVAAGLPPGDYSADKLAVLTAAVHERRRADYPPVEEYIDGVAKGDDAQVANYKAKCLAVKAAHPLPWDANANYKKGDLTWHASKRWKATGDSSGKAPAEASGDWEAA